MKYIKTWELVNEYDTIRMISVVEYQSLRKNLYIKILDRSDVIILCDILQNYKIKNNEWKKQLYFYSEDSGLGLSMTDKCVVMSIVYYTGYGPAQISIAVLIEKLDDDWWILKYSDGSRVGIENKQIIYLCDEFDSLKQCFITTMDLIEKKINSAK